MKFKCCLVLLVVAVASGTAQSNEYWDGDYDSTWWSDEAPAEELGAKHALKDELAADPDNIYYDDLADTSNQSNEKNEEIKAFEDASNNDSSFEVKKLHEMLNKAGDEANDNKPANNVEENLSTSDEQNSKAIQDEIDWHMKNIDEPESDIADNFDDYQVEDNRFDGKDDIVQENKADLPSNSDNSFQPNDFNDPLEEDPSDSLNEEVNYPDFAGDLDGEISQKEELNIDQIVANANELLRENNGPYEEDVEDVKANENQEQESNLLSAENKSDDSDNSFEENEDELFDDIIENQQNEEIEKFLSDVNDDEKLEENKNNENELSSQNDDMSYDKLADDLEQNLDSFNVESDVEKTMSEEMDDTMHALPFAHKYENDMIDPNENIFDNSDDNTDAGNDEPNLEERVGEVDGDEDSVDKVYKDLNEDLAQLFGVWDKLTDDSDEKSNDNVLDYEEKYGKPFGEGVILSQRADYDNYADINDETFDSNLADIFEAMPDSDSNSEEDQDLENPLNKLFEVSKDDIKDKSPVVSVEQVVANDEDSEKNEFDQDLDLGPDEDFILEQGDDVLESAIDAEITRDKKSDDISVKTVNVKDLTPEQYSDVMQTFVSLHGKDLDVQTEEFGRSIAPIHMTLTDEDVTEITSPNFPNTYPTNNVIDWILDGEGTGIELNITDLELRGAQGDFLLIKPGGADDSGHEGLVFSYQLNKPRSYRFTDVDRVFVRFQAGAGLGFLKGFRMTVKMIWPPETGAEILPEPEPLLPVPPGVFSVNLEGVSRKEFSEIQEEFRRLIADMATMYINAKGLDMGLNTTSEVTQLTLVAYCSNINWPNFDNCVEVTFGVPLLYEEGDSTRLDEDDLKIMWTTYVEQDPFAARMRSLGLTEFSIPDENRVLLAWMVLAVGVLISAAMLAFALWRYSCFEDYTRMKTFSDTDSLRDEKRGLDLYPTPHQTLPPLYSETDYKWADSKYDDSTRVDVGFSNRSYVRDELLDIDSDEDVIAARDRNPAIAPRDIYQV